MSVIAVARYLLAEHARSRSFVAPLIVLLGGIVLLYSQPPNPVLSTAGGVAAFLFAIQCWLTLAFLNSQAQPDRHVLAAAAGGRAFVLGRLLAIGWLAGASSLLAILYPLLTASFTRTPSIGELAVILLANLTATIAGSALAALFAQPIVRSRAVSVLGLTLCALLTVPFHLPAAVPTASALNTTRASQVPARLSGDVISVVMFAALVALICARQWRRRE